tara:strand:- start:35 stop:586 length:552 start_codon:yes stop_codon:yes gene_type:complete
VSLKNNKKMAERLIRMRSIPTGTPLHKSLIQATEEVTGSDDFMCRTRHRRLVHARQVLMCAARLSGCTFEACSVFVGLYDHTTAAFAWKKMERDDKLKTDAHAAYNRSKELLAQRELKFAEGVKEMAESAKDEITVAVKPKTVVGVQKPKPLRPNVEELTRKPWEGDSREAKEIARKRDQYYG